MSFFFLLKPLLVLDSNRSFLFTDFNEGLVASLFVSFFIALLFCLPHIFYLISNTIQKGFFKFETQIYLKTVFSVFLLFLMLQTIFYWNLASIWEFFLRFEINIGSVAILLEQKIMGYLMFLAQISGFLFIFLIFFVWIFNLPNNVRISRLITYSISLLFIALFTIPELQFLFFSFFCLCFEIITFLIVCNGELVRNDH